MTNPSDTRDSELVREVRFLLDRLNDFEPYLEEGETFRQYAGHVSPSIERLRSLAADTIDRLTSTGEAVAYRWMNAAGQLVYTSWKPTAAEALRRSVTPLYKHASPREGHVEVPVEVLRKISEIIEKSSTIGAGDFFAIRAMLAALPHNQGETKPEAWDLAARAENGETNL